MYHVAATLLTQNTISSLELQTKVHTNVCNHVDWDTDKIIIGLQDTMVTNPPVPYDLYDGRPNFTSTYRRVPFSIYLVS